MDVFWLVVVLCSWRVLTREYWRTQIVPADPRRLGVVRPVPARARAARAVPGDVLLRRVPADRVDAWAHVVARPVIDGVERVGYPFDLSWTGPWWIAARSLPHVNPWIVAPVTLALLGVVYWAVSKLWEPMGRAEAASGERRPREPGAG